ncbi:response regulator [Sinomicrobium weinanense]|uniref:histidine kinase n=1 Tax=Sinomicrobium weinanense TaxID=2842200 RepID=A0A926JNV0_9FLAO|nr:response regulator [Sinomicrobium weinanense]MBC9794745.1 response regulator [Sinomicrobium weinanense]MBU3125004.1 response regulator [Sinomicrobium weinanense]
MSNCPDVHTKYLLAINLVLWGCMMSMAQTSHKLDSIKNIIATTENDSIRIEAYNDFFPYWIHKNLDSSRFYTEKGYEHAKKTGIPKGIADLSVFTAYVDIRRENYKQAHQILDEAYKLLKKDGSYKPGEFHVLNWKSSIYFEEGKTDSAKHVLKEIVEASASEFPQNTLLAYSRMGDIAASERNFHEAIGYYLKVDSLCMAYNREGASYCNSSLANIGVIFKEELLQLDKGLEYLSRGRQGYAEKGEDILVYEIDIEIAEIYFIRKQYEKAESLLKLALEFFREQEIAKNSAAALNVLGKVYLLSDRYDETAVVLQEEYELGVKNKDTFHMASALIHKGMLSTRKGSYTAAENQLKEGAGLASRMENNYLEEVAYKGLTQLYHSREDYKNAFLSQEKWYGLQIEKEKKINQSELSELETRYQTGKKKQEIALLTARNKLVGQQKKTQKIIFTAISGILLLGAVSIFILYKNREKTTKKLKELDRIKTRFFSNLSHEFRTPLTLISGPVEHQLSKKGLSSDDELDFRLIQRNANRIMELIDQLLELARLDAGGRKPAVGYYNLELFIRQLLEPFQYLADKQQIRFQYNITGIKMAWFDREILYKVLSNLFSNAVKYTDRNGYVKVEVMQKGRDAVFRVTNTGSQLDKTDIEHIFTRFYQSDTNSGGVGIGLSLVKELVSVNRGDIAVAKNKNGEVCFRVSLPVVREAFSEDEIAEHYPAEEAQPFSGMEHKDSKISNGRDIFADDNPLLLIVDDNADICLFVENIFKQDYRVIKAGNGQEGIDKALKAVPDVIISDIMMPVKDGIYLANTLKNDERTSHIPIILLTAKSGNNNEISGLKTGADAYIVKPFQQEKLRVLIENLLKNRQLVQQQFRNTGLLSTTTAKVSPKDHVFIKRLKEVLAKNLTEPVFNAANFGEAMCMSRMQLHRKLKALTGQSATEFIKDQRLRLAAQLLKKSGVSISEVAYRVGFNQPAYFATCFKEAYKVSPSEYGERNNIDN